MLGGCKAERQAGNNTKGSFENVLYGTNKILEQWLKLNEKISDEDAKLCNWSQLLFTPVMNLSEWVTLNY